MSKQFVSCQHTGLGHTWREAGSIPWGVAVIRGYAVYIGYIGQTACCGSGEIWGGAFNKEMVHEVLQHSKASLLYAHWTVQAPWGSNLSDTQYINKIVKETNVEGVFNITVKMEGQNAMWISVNIEDFDAYNSWVNK